jgi:hypothetical protein
LPAGLFAFQVFRSDLHAIRTNGKDRSRTGIASRSRSALLATLLGFARRYLPGAALLVVNPPHPAKVSRSQLFVDTPCLSRLPFAVKSNRAATAERYPGPKRILEDHRFGSCFVGHPHITASPYAIHHLGVKILTIYKIKYIPIYSEIFRFILKYSLLYSPQDSPIEMLCIIYRTDLPPIACPHRSKSYEDFATVCDMSSVQQARLS